MMRIKVGGDRGGIDINDLACGDVFRFVSSGEGHVMRFDFGNGPTRRLEEVRR
jgi:hypothetical protein